MESTRKKFATYLQERLDITKKKLVFLLGVDVLLSDELLRDEFSDLFNNISYLERLIKTLSNEKSDTKCNVITDDFCGLSISLLNSPLKGKECMEIIMDFIEQNIDRGLLLSKDNVVIIDSHMAKEKGISESAVIDLAYSGELNKLVNADDDELTSKEKMRRDALLQIATEFKNENTIDFITEHEVIKKHFLDKRDTYTSDDIKYVIESLKSLRIEQELCQIIEILLEKKLAKRNRKQSDHSVKMNLNIKKDNKYISDKEYKQIKSEIKSYFDMYNMQPVRELTEDEILYCAHLLLKIDTDPNLIKTFFYRNQKEVDLTNPIGTYNQMYNKLNYYKERQEVVESVNNINSYIEEIFITNSEDYSFWKNEIKNELNKVIKNIPTNYKYELSQASNFKKSKIKKIY